MLLSELPGQPLPWIALNDLAIAHRTFQLVHEAVDRLHALTPGVRAHPIASSVPSITLEAELQAILARGGPWFEVPLFREALAGVQANLARFRQSLVFSNGDYNPLNFLAAGDALVGWIDFDGACFEDPLIGFAKFLLWADDATGWGAGARAGLGERYLYTHLVPPAAFLVRLVLRGLHHLQDTSPLRSAPLYAAGHFRCDASTCQCGAPTCPGAPFINRIPEAKPALQGAPGEQENK